MRPANRVSWSLLGIGLTVFAVVLGVGAGALEYLGARWPGWAVPVVAGIAGVAAAGVKLLLDQVATLSAGQLRSAQDRLDTRTRLLTKSPGYRRGLPRLSEIGDRARHVLGIHPAIPLPPGNDELSTDLPTYVARDIDTELREWLAAHGSGSGGFALIVGPAAAGKTRTAFEAARAVLPGWRLLVVESGRDVVDLLDTGFDAGRTVVWLNDLPRLLGPGGLTATTVRRLLACRPGPILVGTIWPSDFERLTRMSDDAATGVGRAAAEILTVLATRFDLVARFSQAEWQRIRELAAVDPRLREVCDHAGDANPTELLAAAPDLIRRWRNPGDEFGAAAVSAAIAMRRCGLPEPLRERLLAKVAVTYLTPAQRAAAGPSWLDAALRWACTPVRGTVAPLTRVAVAPGGNAGLTVSDVLVHDAESDTASPGGPVPDEVWRLCVQHAGPAIGRVGVRAFHEGRFEHAAQALDRAARRDTDGDALHHLAYLAEADGDIQRAEDLWAKAVAAGSCCARIPLAWKLLLRGKLDRAQQLLDATSADHPGYPLLAGVLALARGDDDRAAAWWPQAAVEQDAKGLADLRVLAQESRFGVSSDMWWAAAEAAGDGIAMYELGSRAYKNRDIAEARRWWTKGAEAGNGCCMDMLGDLAIEDGDQAGAQGWYRKAIDHGCLDGAASLGEILIEHGGDDAEEARRLWRQAADEGSASAMFNLAVDAAERGQRAEEEAWLRKAANLKFGCAMDRLGHLLSERGEYDAALDLWHRAAEAGCHHAAESLRTARG